MQSISRLFHLYLVAGLMAGLAFIVQPERAQAAQIDITGPAGSGAFGTQVLALPNGNIVVTDPLFSADGQANVGAVYLYNGRTHTLISTLTGDTAEDRVGGRGVTLLTNGNYLVSSPRWGNGGVANAGAVTWCSGDTGCAGVVTTTNSLVGALANDQVGSFDAVALTNGNYVVVSAYWNNGSATRAGAVTWGNGATGITGTVSAANSLVGTTTDDRVGRLGVTALTNGNYVVSSPYWNNDSVTQVGAVTWGDGATGITGVVTTTNSLIGGTANDLVGSNRVTALTQDNYVVASNVWHNGEVTEAGAVTWGDGATGITGVVTLTNSLVGSTAGDRIGDAGVTALTNGNYAVSSPRWNNGGVGAAGAVTWGDGAMGITGVVTLTNSLVGSAVSDQIGNAGVTALVNGNYVASSVNWKNGGAALAGAVTWGDGATGITGVVTVTNSLVGSAAFDRVGNVDVTALTQGNYVVSSRNWRNGAVVGAGAATWGNGATGITGVVTLTNSLVGTTYNDQVGSGGVTALTNGNYVVTSVQWNYGAVVAAGAVTWGNGVTGVTGVVTTTNSLVGGAPNDLVGASNVTALTNGHYAVGSRSWNNGAATQVGAVTWGNGVTGVTGVVTTTNSLVGATDNDQVSSGSIWALTNGTYVVNSLNWSNGVAAEAGAVTLGNALGGPTGPITRSNSVLGVASNGYSLNYADDVANNQVVVGRPAENRVTFLGGDKVYLPFVRR